MSRQQQSSTVSKRFPGLRGTVGSTYGSGPQARLRLGTKTGTNPAPRSAARSKIFSTKIIRTCEEPVNNLKVPRQRAKLTLPWYTIGIYPPTAYTHIKDTHPMQVTKNISHKGSVIYYTLKGRCVARTCIYCGEFKKGSQFINADANSVNGGCRDCELSKLRSITHNPISHNKKIKRYRRKNAAKSDRTLARIQSERYPDRMKTCTMCKTTLPLKDFGVSRGNPDGLMYRCKKCNAKSARRSEESKRK